MNLAGRKERNENKTIYPIIQNQKRIRNKILDNNGCNTMKSLENKTIFNYFNNNHKKNTKNNKSKAKSLKIIHQENKCFKTQESRDKKIDNFLNKNNLRHSVKMKNNMKRSNYTFFTFYDDIKNNRNEMNDILNQLLNIKQKINAINLIKNKKLKNLGESHKSINKNLEKMTKSPEQKEELLKSIHK